MRAIFISYRRDDAEGQAGRLFDDLVGHFGSDAVFMDVAAIEPGRDFRRVIDEHVASCGVLLAIIGKSWLNSVDGSGQRRLDDAMDFVRLETASALKRDIPVVPVLVHGASMPRADQLPADLAELAFRNGVELTHARWDSDVQLLLKALQPYVHTQQSESDKGKTETTTSTARPSMPDRGPSEPAARATSATRPASTRLSMIIGVLVAVIALAVGGYTWQQKSLEAAENARKAEALAEANKLATAQLETERAAAQKAEADRLAKDKLAADAAAAQRTRDAAAAEARRQEQEKEAANEAAKQAADKAAADELAAKARMETARRAKETAAAAAEAKRQEQEREAAKQAANQAAADALAAKARIEAARRARWHSQTFPPPNAGAVLITFVNGNPACASYNAASCLWGMTYEQIDFTRIKPLICGEGHRAKWGTTGYEDPKHWCSLARRANAAKN